MSAVDVLADRRAEIERTDQELIALLARRVRLSEEIGAIKRAEGLPLLDPKREAEVIRAAAEAARAHGLPAEPVREIFWQIIALARHAQLEEP